MYEEKNENEELPGPSFEEEPAGEEDNASSDDKSYERAMSTLATECPQLLVPLTDGRR